MEEKKRITPIEALQATLDILNHINVPVYMMQQIGIPIAQATGNIREIILAASQAEDKAKQEAAEEEKALREEDI